MKKVDFRQLSDIRCVDCNQPLKQNLINRKPNAIRCWVCFRIHIGHVNKELQNKQHILMQSYTHPS
jgi:hypothetical protein